MWPECGYKSGLWDDSMFRKESYAENLKKSWVPFRSYMLNSTANPAHLHSNWAGLAELFSR